MNRFLIEWQSTRLTNILQRQHRRSPASQKQIHKILMRKNDPCFYLVFGKANQSGLLFLIRQTNLVRNNPISFSRNIDMQGYVCVSVQQIIQALPCQLPFCPYSFTASFCFAVFFPSSSNILFYDTSDHVPVLSDILTFSFLTATLLSPSCPMQVFMASVFAASSSLFPKDTSNHNFTKAQFPAQNCSSPAE